MKRRNKLGLLVMGSLGAFFIICGFAFNTFFYSWPQIKSKFTSAKLSTDSNICLFVIHRERYLEPKGFTAWPDGGSRKYLTDMHKFGYVDVKNRRKKLL